MTTPEPFFMDEDPAQPDTFVPSDNDDGEEA